MGTSLLVIQKFICGESDSIKQNEQDKMEAYNKSFWIGGGDDRQHTEKET